MSYSDDAVRAKLSSLNETQDSIVAVAQWIMFHRRHADRTAQLWLARLQEAPMPKRLNLIYLANEVVQQSRARSKTDFLYAFEPLIGEAVASAYKGASIDLQNKLKRVAEVWRARNIFDATIQSSVEKRMEELDRLRGGANGAPKPRLGGSLFGDSGGAVPPELQTISRVSVMVTRAELASKTAIPNAEAEYAKMNDPNTTVPSPPVHAARLNTLLKSLASAHSALEGCIKARTDMVADLEQLLATHKSKLVEEQEQAESFRTRTAEVESKKKAVEDQIMQGLSTPDVTTPAPDAATEDGHAPSTRPEPESFTPPPPEVEAFTPPAQPDGPDPETLAAGDTDPQEAPLADTIGTETMHGTQSGSGEPLPSHQPPHFDLLQSLSRHVPEADSNADPRLKRRKIAHNGSSADGDEAIFAQDDLGIDEDGVASLLGN